MYLDHLLNIIKKYFFLMEGECWISEIIFKRQYRKRNTVARAVCAHVSIQQGFSNATLFKLKSSVLIGQSCATGYCILNRAILRRYSPQSLVIFCL